MNSHLQLKILEQSVAVGRGRVSFKDVVPADQSSDLSITHLIVSWQYRLDLMGQIRQQGACTMEVLLNP